MKKTAALLILLIWLTGCGRTVTDKTITDSSGQTVDIREVEFTFTFAGEPAANLNQKYYLIIATQNILIGDASYLLNGTRKYFASPEDALVTHNQQVIEEYFSKTSADENDMRELFAGYFAGWDSYYIYDSAGQLLRAVGPFVYGNNVEPAPTGWAVTKTGKSLKWKMPLPYTDFYFALLTVENGAGYTRYLRDGLAELGHVESERRQISGTDTNDFHTDIPLAQNIQNYTVVVNIY